MSDAVRMAMPHYIVQVHTVPTTIRILMDFHGVDVLLQVRQLAKMRCSNSGYLSRSRKIVAIEIQRKKSPFSSI